MTSKQKQSGKVLQITDLTMDRVLNKVQNKNEYFFSQDERKNILDFIISMKFIWIKSKNVFRLRDKFKSTQIEIHIASCHVLIYNDKEVSKLILTLKEYQDFILAIQDYVTNE